MCLYSYCVQKLNVVLIMFWLEISRAFACLLSAHVDLYICITLTAVRECWRKTKNLCSQCYTKSYCFGTAKVKLGRVRMRRESVVSICVNVHSSGQSCQSSGEEIYELSSANLRNKL